MCKAHSKVTHKTAKIFSSPQGPWIKYTVLIISTALEVIKIFFAVLFRPMSLCYGPYTLL